MLDISAYLRRIDYRGPRDPTPQTLQALHTAHMLAVPFENLDIHRRPIILDEAALFDKIVMRRRGGFCYELNGLFAALLRALGFDVTLLSARVARANGGFGPEFDHLTLLIALGERWLADVGFGDAFRAPLRLDDPGEQHEGARSYRLAREEQRWLMLQRDAGADWEPQYAFTLQPRRLADFVDMCHYHQTSPESSFTQRRICSRATPDGRVTLSDMKLIVTTQSARQERLLADQGEYDAALKQHFGIDLEAQNVP
jgi:N-hydroxyarylamine O-acetyltransferase